MPKRKSRNQQWKETNETVQHLKMKIEAVKKSQSEQIMEIKFLII